MLVFDFRTIGNKLYTIRHRLGMTQAEVAEAAGLSDRTYADIERGSANMRMETLLRICTVLQITPNEILTERFALSNVDEVAILNRLQTCSAQEKETALRLLLVYFQSLD